MFSKGPKGHSHEVQRTSDVPVMPPAEGGDHPAKRVKRTSDLPVVEKGQGLRGQQKVNMGAGLGGPGSGGLGHGR